MMRMAKTSTFLFLTLCVMLLERCISKPHLRTLRKTEHIATHKTFEQRSLTLEQQTTEDTLSKLDDEFPINFLIPVHYTYSNDIPRTEKTELALIDTCKSSPTMFEVNSTTVPIAPFLLCVKLHVPENLNEQHVDFTVEEECFMLQFVDQHLTKVYQHQLKLDGGTAALNLKVATTSQENISCEDDTSVSVCQPIFGNATFYNLPSDQKPSQEELEQITEAAFNRSFDQRFLEAATLRDSNGILSYATQIRVKPQKLTESGDLSVEQAMFNPWQIALMCGGGIFVGLVLAATACKCSKSKQHSQDGKSKSHTPTTVTSEGGKSYFCSSPFRADQRRRLDFQQLDESPSPVPSSPAGTAFFPHTLSDMESSFSIAPPSDAFESSIIADTDDGRKTESVTISCYYDDKMLDESSLSDLKLFHPAIDHNTDEMSEMSDDISLQGKGDKMWNQKRFEVLWNQADDSGSESQSTCGDAGFARHELAQVGHQIPSTNKIREVPPMLPRMQEDQEESNEQFCFEEPSEGLVAVDLCDNFSRVTSTEEGHAVTEAARALVMDDSTDGRFEEPSEGLDAVGLCDNFSQVTSTGEGHAVTEAASALVINDSTDGHNDTKTDS